MIVEVSRGQLHEFNLFEKLRTCSFSPIIKITFECNLASLKDLENIINYLSRFNTVKYIVLNPDCYRDFNFNAYMKLNKMGSSDLQVFLDRGNFPANLLKEHPYNAYILNFKRDHPDKKGLPRYLVINSNGCVFPEGLDERFEDFKLGNIYNQTLFEMLEGYWLSNNHVLFKTVCEQVYNDYILDYPFYFIPWRYLFIKEILTGISKSF
ncbi:MAG: hypothetical protein KAX49_10125 [Halanaerobiales bacterium]|nr:hypothetical protein [Halanaerobiales bacterium]